MNCWCVASQLVKLLVMVVIVNLYTVASNRGHWGISEYDILEGHTVCVAMKDE